MIARADLAKTEIPAYEYFCYNCGQLRLSIGVTSESCSNCGSLHILKGEPGKLDKKFLKKIYAIAIQMKYGEK
ncbi:hypothetical protein LCGC14_2036110 [marine sediment metagenome]|uniref:Uncharacterized protein n=1 Tax=marine sediment metagenome TaxID=412755 RepID=A0A0F9HQB9_9ZZZZ|nr:hypothetical protein [Pricia sp.]